MPGPLAPPVPTPMNALPIVQSNADKLVSGAMYAGNNAMMTAAPALNNLIPGSNPTGAGGIEVSLLGNGILVVIQAMQTLSFRGHRFDRDRYGIWVIIALAIGVCLFLWRDSELQKGAINAAGTMWAAFSGTGPLNKLGVLGPITNKPN